MPAGTESDRSEDLESESARGRAARVLAPAALLLPLAVSIAACGPTAPEDRVSFEFDFTAGDRGFVAGFTDYPVGREEDVGFVADHRPLPPPLAQRGGALYHRGLNISDDLFMYFKRRLEGLEPGRAYRATFALEFATDVGEGCEIGVGTSVFLKAGASAREPTEVVRDGDVRLGVDKGEQRNRGEAAVLLGDIRNGEPGCGSEVPFALETRDAGEEVVELTADGTGAAWLFFGSESAFEVAHEVYFTRLRATLVRR